VNRAGQSLIVAMSDPSNIYAVDDLKFTTGYNIEPVVASEPSIREAIERYYAERGPRWTRFLGAADEQVDVAERRTTSSTSRRPTMLRSSSW
jgi:type IV pilus assembly protein PilB